MSPPSTIMHLFPWKNNNKTGAGQSKDWELAGTRAPKNGQTRKMAVKRKRRVRTGSRQKESVLPSFLLWKPIATVPSRYLSALCHPFLSIPMQHVQSRHVSDGRPDMPAYIETFGLSMWHFSCILPSSMSLFSYTLTDYRRSDSIYASGGNFDRLQGSVFMLTSKRI